MADETISGLVATLEASSDGGTTYVKVGELKEWSLKVSRNMINTGTKDSGGWERTKPGRAKFSGSAKGLYVESNAGQEALFDALIDGTVLKARFRPAGAVEDAFQYVGDIVISDWDLSSPEEEVHAVDISFTGASALVRTDQPAPV